MHPFISNLIKVLISIALASGVMYFAFNSVDMDAFFAKSKLVKWEWIILSMFIGFFSYVFRAFRWKIMFHPLGYRPTLFRTYLAVMSGYLANLLVPRLGEVVRCGVLKKSDDIPVAASLGTVITERLIDLLTLGLLLLLTLLFEYEQVVDFLNTTLNLDFNWPATLIVAVAVLGIGAWVFFRFIYPSDTRLGSFSRGVIEGLISLRKVKLVPFILSTLAIWITYYLMTFVSVYALDETSGLPWEAGLSMLVAGVVAFVLPVQSGFGTFHVLVSTMLLLYSVDEVTGKFLASLLHTSQLLAVLIYGLIAGILSIFVKRITKHDAGKN